MDLMKGKFLAFGLAAVLSTSSCQCNDNNNGSGDVGDDSGVTPDQGSESDAAQPDAEQPDAGGRDAAPDGGDAGDSGPIEGPDPSGGAWSDDFSAPGMQAPLGGRVNAVARAADGTVYAGGIFEVAGKTPVNAIARWNGSGWEPLGAGLDLDVEAIAVADDGKVYAGGFSSGGFGIGGGSNALWQWDGAIWSELAVLSGDFTRIGALQFLDDGRLVVGGEFAGIGTTDSANLAAWDGTSWSAIGAGAPDAAVHAIEPIAAGEFCVGGDFGTIAGVQSPFAACWDGTQWLARPGLEGSVATLHRDSTGRLFAGGTLAFTDPMTGNYLAGIALWNGTSWEPFQGGVDGGFINEVRAIEEGPDGKLYVGGTFKLVGKGQQNLAVNHIARWAGSQWEAVGAGVENTTGVVLGSEVGVSSLLFDGNELIVGGLFSRAGDSAAHNIARWDGAAWHRMVADELYLGVGGVINALVVDGAKLFAGGYFSHAGETTAANVAVFESDSWAALGQGVDDVVFTAAGSPDGVLIGGAFSNAPVTGASFLARWEPPVWKGLGAGPNNVVTEIMVAENGDVYIGGDFTAIGNVAAKSVAKWNGDSWEALGDGLDGRVSALHFGPDGALYAGGLFEQNGAGVPVGHIARYDGEKWVEVGGGLDGRVASLATYQDKLLAGGTFEKAGDVPLHSVGLWDGASWSAVGGGIPSEFDGISATVSDIEVYGAGFFVAGTFSMIGDRMFNYLAWFDGTEYHPLGEGLSDLPEDLVVVGNRLWIGGSFTQAGGVPAYGLTYWEWPLED